MLFYLTKINTRRHDTSIYHSFGAYTTVVIRGSSHDIHSFLKERISQVFSSNPKLLVNGN